MKKILLCMILAALLIPLSGCSQTQKNPLSKYSAVYLDYFDTVITLTGYAESQAQFDAVAERAEEEFQRLHAVFDRYAPHEGVDGVWALNHAQGQPVPVDPDLMELLRFARDRYDMTERRVNVAMGAVLDVWHVYRERGKAVPTPGELEQANRHSAFSNLVLDEQAMTARLLDPEASLDMGALAKGYAVEKVARMIEAEMPSYLLDAGGNIRTGAAPADGRDAWTVGITDPQAALRGEQAIALKMKMTGLSAVTSGGYQRYYTVDGRNYHHLIDPDTLMPADYVMQVTILTQDSGWADMLSTAAFLMPYEEAREMIEALEGVEAVWVLENGEVQMTEGAKALLESR